MTADRRPARRATAPKGMLPLIGHFVRNSASPRPPRTRSLWVGAKGLEAETISEPAKDHAALTSADGGAILAARGTKAAAARSRRDQAHGIERESAGCVARDLLSSEADLIARLFLCRHERHMPFRGLCRSVWRRETSRPTRHARIGALPHEYRRSIKRLGREVAGDIEYDVSRGNRVRAISDAQSSSRTEGHCDPVGPVVTNWEVESRAARVVRRDRTEVEVTQSGLLGHG